MHLQAGKLDVHAAGESPARLTEDIPTWRVPGADQLVEITLVIDLASSGAFTGDIDFK